MPAGSRRGEALLAATSVGATSLLLGGGCERLADFIPRLGGRVVSAAFGPAEPGAAPVATADQAAIRTGADFGLPFPDSSFDSIFAPQLFEYTAAGRAVAELLLRECARVLKPGGRILLWVPNRSPIRALLRLLQSPRAVRGAAIDYGVGGFTRDRLERLLRDAGFGKGTVYLPWPRYASWTSLVPQSLAANRSLPRARGRRAKLHRFARTISARIGADGWLVPEYCVVAVRSGDARAGAPPSAEPVLHRLLREAGGTSTEADRIELEARGERVITFVAAGNFYKVPVTPVWEARLRNELDGNARAAATKARDFMVATHQRGTLGQLPYAAFPVAEVGAYRGAAAELAALEEAFTRLAVGAERIALDRADAWARLFSESSRMRLRAVGAGALMDRLRDTTADRTVPAGITHGDLHIGNVLRHDGRIALIDWDRFEACSPLLIDRFNAVYRLLMRRHGRSAGERAARAALESIAHRRAGTPFLDLLEQVAGELSWIEAISFHVLNGASWRLTQTSASALPAAERELRGLVASCESWWTRH